MRERLRNFCLLVVRVGASACAVVLVGVGCCSCFWPGGPHQRPPARGVGCWVCLGELGRANSE